MRKILAILLTICMLSTLVVMPVSAAETTITVNVTAEGLGTNTVMDGDYAVFDELGDSASFQVTITEAAAYYLQAVIQGTSSVKRQLAPACYVDDVLVGTGFHEKDYYPLNTSNGFNMATVWLKPGTYTVKIENFAGAYKLRALNVVKTDLAEDSVSADFFTYAGLGVPYDKLWNWGVRPESHTSDIGPYGVMFAGAQYPLNMVQSKASTTTVKVGVRETGAYKVVANLYPVANAGSGLSSYNKYNVTLGSATNAVNGVAIDTATWKEFVLFEAINLTEGTHELTISCSGSLNVQTAWDKITLVKYPDLEVDTMKANGTAFENTDTIGVGTDSFSFEFNTALTSAGTVSIQSGETTVAVAPATFSGSTVTANLKESLAEDTAYTLTLNGVTDEMNRTFSEKTVTFVTDSVWAGSSTIEIDEENTTIVEDTVTVKGVLKSSAGVGIKGRAISVAITSPASAADIMATGVTGDDGAFTLTFDLNPQGEGGRYDFAVSDLIGSEDTFNRIYLGSLAETIVETVKNATNATEVESAFYTVVSPGVTYNSLMEIDPNAKLAEITGVLPATQDAKTLFYNHFVDFNGTLLDELTTLYNKAVAFETLNQGVNNADIKAILDSTEWCTLFELNKAYIDVIGTTTDSFITAAKNIETKTSIADYKTALDAVINDALLAKYNKTADIADGTISKNGGQGATFDLKFSAANDGQKDITSIELVLSNMAGDAGDVDLENSIFTDLTGETVENVYADEKITITFDAAETFAVALAEDGETELPTALGTISITSPSTAGTYKVNVAAKLSYAKDSAVFTDEVDAVLTLNATTYTPSPGGGGSGGGGGASSTSSPAASTAPKPDKNDETDKPGTEEPGTDKPGTDEPGIGTGDFKFNDIESVDWAAESINSLLDKGIISKSADGKFNPNNEVTREEFVKMMVVAMGVYDETAASNLKDVNKNEWYAAYVASAEKAGLISGNDDGTFGVGDEISREDMSVIIYRAMAKLGLIEAVEGEDFADDSEISDYAKEAVYALKDLGILNGVGDNKFAPQGTATRAMAAKVIYGMLEGISK